MDYSNFAVINWTTGSLWWKKNHSFNQAQYVSPNIGKSEWFKFK